jgi:hypothetical protein
LTAQAAGQAQQGIDDAKVLQFAASQTRIVLTFNRRHFLKLHRSSPYHPGIIICTTDDDIAALAARIDAAIRANEPLAGKLVRVNKPS